MTTYVTTVPMTTFSLTPASPLPSITSLIARLLRFLAAWLLAISFSIEPGCMNCGHTWQEKGAKKTGIAQAQLTRRAGSRRQLYAELDRSMRQGYLI